MFSIKHALIAAGVGIAASAHAGPVGASLSIDDIDQLARANIARQLSGGAVGNGMLPPGAMTQLQPGIAASSVTADVAPQPLEKPVRQPRAHGDPVTFLGAFNDETGAHVLYSYRDAIYPARVGATLLNGWSVKGVDGYAVTVVEGKRVWKEPIRGSAPIQSPATNAIRSLVDLASPLPAGAPLRGVPLGGGQ
ncbi:MULTISPECIES: hypothetical protein [Burkholderia]|uniref:hypothetical protein n=1 Tax=Burkholderia TaxID=32008 RepID=UPI000755D501|nr:MULTISPECIES: hypothetical protein [Burkholderia]AOJ73337.1 hypothetical protein WS78_31110 [Burkholderia savannae]KVG43041.1 hypothetical protein WS77_13420 [Burkholderia sp. MSMB0265]KVG87540.1 hypothetical protein WS81_26860 [Burkholderia sp. MSMB2040]KVG92059.1 hypothetical protein WS83_12310 [Burkholderia sp. MSMB2042]KVH01130.1 hypothetical protein WS82_22410 [Burkholderia sp. MSMB2041]